MTPGEPSFCRAAVGRLDIYSWPERRVADSVLPFSPATFLDAGFPLDPLMGKEFSMFLHDDEQFLAAVAAALGETIALVRHRGFHLERTVSNGDPRPAHSCSRSRPEDDDVLDLAAHGIDWDAADDWRLHRRPRRMIARRRRSAA